MLNVIMLSVTNKPSMLSFIMVNIVMLGVTNKPLTLSVIMLNVVAPPTLQLEKSQIFTITLTSVVIYNL